MCCWTGISVRKLYFSAKFLNVDHALVYDDEVDAVKLESRSLFTTRVNLDKAEDWESRLVVCRPNVLIVEIAVPGIFFSSKPNGEHCMSTNGLESNGPNTLPYETSLRIFYQQNLMKKNIWKTMY